MKYLSALRYSKYKKKIEDIISAFHHFKIIATTTKDSHLSTIQSSMPFYVDRIAVERYGTSVYTSGLM